MSSASVAAPRRMTLKEFFEYEHEFKHELVAGILEMCPPEGFGNRLGLTRLGRLLESAGVDWAPDVGVMLDPTPARATVRVPDFVAVRAGSIDEARTLDPSDVVFIAELVSPSSRRKDWQIKAREYGRAGVPLYLVIYRQRQRLALFTHPGVSGYEHVTQDASQVTVPLLGTDIVVALSELG